MGSSSDDNSKKKKDDKEEEDDEDSEESRSLNSLDNLLQPQLHAAHSNSQHGVGVDQDELVPILEVSSSSLVAPSGHSSNNPNGAEDGDDGSRDSGLTEESSSFSEYEEDLFPEGDGATASKDSNKNNTTDDDDDDDDNDDDAPSKQDTSKERRPANTSTTTTNTTTNNSNSKGKGGRFESPAFGASASNMSYHSATQHSIQVSPLVWARTWEDRAKAFQEAHPDEYKAIEKKMKQKDIKKIEEERSQRIFENKLFGNVDRFFKILGGAACALCCCTIFITIILAVLLKGDGDAPPAPTFPPFEGISSITKPPKLRTTNPPTIRPSPTSTLAPSRLAPNATTT